MEPNASVHATLAAPTLNQEISDLSQISTEADRENISDDREYTDPGQSVTSPNDVTPDETVEEGDQSQTDEDSQHQDLEKGDQEAETEKEEFNRVITPPLPEVMQIEEVFDPSEFPASYKNNLPQEQIVLQYADNFRRQYVQLYRDRAALLLNPVNECGVEKFVCTTIRPTLLPFKELNNWTGAAEFVADYLCFDTLEPAFELPKRLISPATVLRRQQGSCFEYSTLLCSLLIGAGYDAYVVSGYATKETCFADESRETCPLTIKKKEDVIDKPTKQVNKYTVKPPKDFRSKFELRMEAQRKAELKAEENRRKAEEKQRLLELEKPAPDPLVGRRIHSWVLVLAGKREVPETFFIEPLTGLSHGHNSEAYLGIESVWNHANYWVNMQSCSDGVTKLNYDLGDCASWEFMFPSVDKPQLLLPEEDENYEDDLDNTEDEDKVEKEEEQDIDLPPSWVEPLQLSQRDFEMRCPHGKKIKLYKKAKLEKFAHYLMSDGLICRLSIFDNRELTDLLLVREYFAHRKDKLDLRVHDKRTGWLTEFFQPGRPKHLKEHCYKGSSPEAECERTMYFYHQARTDGLVQREETPLTVTEHYKDRSDFLFYGHVEFGKRSKKFGPQEEASSQQRPIIRMIQKFHRNLDKPASADIQELTFLVAEDKIQVTYHTEPAHIASATREFIKPANWDDKGAVLHWSPEMHNSFQADPHAEPSKQVALYENLLAVLKMEDSCRAAVRNSEEEVREILNNRHKEEIIYELEISVYDTERNEKAKKHRREFERMLAEAKLRKEETEMDYLAAFLAQIGGPEKLTRAQAIKLKEDCLADLKQRLINKANLIQARFEMETQELQKKQLWYQQNQVSMSKEDEEHYLNYCSEAMFRIHILEVRLSRHKEVAPHKYMALEQKLRNDPRLCEFI